ncbi:hypothetical protein [Streptomyces sp. NPDC058193]|uniref:hypothetical protein n=1 Tax=Streptomyces sp. NPDC058193 TaxID=3346373 RepID=UPI0036E233CD
MAVALPCMLEYDGEGRHGLVEGQGRLQPVRDQTGPAFLLLYAPAGWKLLAGPTPRPGGRAPSASRTLPRF